ncbi:MAG: kynureninase [Candidatus Kapaibacterium sp.]
MINIDDLKKDVNPLSEHYKDFRVTERILLTGHSHQAQPDCSKEGILQCWKDASELADDKWKRVFAAADKFRLHISELLDDDKENIVFGQNTHDLILRFLSALDFKSRKKIITSDGEFHTIRRQLDRLNQGYLEVIKVKRDPIGTLSERLIKEIDDSVLAVMVSKVMFQDASIVSGFAEVEESCTKHGAKLLVDIYHVLNAIPFSLKEEKLENSFLVGGGYKYLQLGEGNCFMRIPPNEIFKPVITGWFAEFAALSAKKNPGEVLYGDKHWAFEGSTYDPVSHYRAVKVFEFFKEQKLTPLLLREINNHQKDVIESEFKGYDLDPVKIKVTDVKERGGFMTFLTPHAGIISNKLREHNILTDYRGDFLRFGPAPYLADSQLKEAVECLKDIVNIIKT